MTNIDLVEKVIIPIGAAFVGAIVGAILAFKYQNRMELNREKRQILQILMMYRSVGANELNFINALNTVDTVYHDNKVVRELLHTFFEQTMPDLFSTKQHVETFYKMLHEMAIDCGYDNLTLHEIRDSYSPEILDLHYPNRMPQKQPSAS
jgi:hypothetical protein